MVMRRVLKHHVCLCVLSTAVLAGLAFITAQEVYAGSKNCNGVASPGGGGDGSDRSNERIECDGSSGGGRTKNLSGIRNINMGKDSGAPAVKVYGSGADITISSEPLKITGDSGNNPAIKVYGQGKLTVMNVTATDVYKGIVAEDGGSVTVLQGSIGVRENGGAVIEVNG
ncbi:hypothetical protein, partial [Bartonella schoenbuchensis]|uniref:hypothetical protein n=1 Tax=Bartonella schoenbuchensis TaxID=165694 RepID=UPI001ABAF5CF